MGVSFGIGVHETKVWYRYFLIAHRVSATDRRERNPTVCVVLYASLHEYYYYTVVAVAVLAMGGIPYCYGSKSCTRYRKAGLLIERRGLPLPSQGSPEAQK